MLKNRGITGTHSWVQEPQDFLPAMQKHFSLSVTTSILKTYCWTTELMSRLSCSLWLQLGLTNNLLCQSHALGSIGAAGAQWLDDRCSMKFKNITAYLAPPGANPQSPPPICPYLILSSVSFSSVSSFFSLSPC